MIKIGVSGDLMHTPFSLPGGISYNENVDVAVCGRLSTRDGAEQDNGMDLASKLCQEFALQEVDHSLIFGLDCHCTLPSCRRRELSAHGSSDLRLYHPDLLHQGR